MDATLSQIINDMVALSQRVEELTRECQKAHAKLQESERRMAELMGREDGHVEAERAEA